MKSIQVLLPASKIPLEAVVTKRGGDVHYKLSDRIAIYQEGAPKQEILAKDGCRFLIGLRGGNNVNAISGDTELLWLPDSFDELRTWLDNEECDSHT